MLLYLFVCLFSVILCAAPTNVTVYYINDDLHVQWDNIDSLEVQQYRVLVAPAEDTGSGASCNETVTIDVNGSVACGNLKAFLNYSVTVRGEGITEGPYSKPVYFLFEKDGEWKLI